MGTRQSNIELLRIIAMIMVVLLHSNYMSLGWMTQNEVLNRPIDSLIRILCEQICIVGVDIFVLISGWFGINPSLKGALKLIYQVVFFGIIILLFAIIFKLDIPIKESIDVLWGGNLYWFIPAYLGLYILSPVLNNFVENCDAKTICGVLAAFFTYELFYGWFRSSATINNGSSLVSFIGLYILARFINFKSPKIKYIEPSKAIILYSLITLFTSLLAYFGYKYINHPFAPTYYCSPFVISAALLLLLFFQNISLDCKLINIIAQSAFAVYLIHEHPIVVPYFRNFMANAYTQYGGSIYIFFAIFFAFCIFTGSVILDRTRIVTWKFICKTFLDKFVLRIENTFSKMFNFFLS